VGTRTIIFKQADAFEIHFGHGAAAGKTSKAERMSETHRKRLDREASAPSRAELPPSLCGSVHLFALS
ncbi:MAG: hypothetical protein QXI12_13205, partial [Candidatus Methanomethyliaceae archaeon]